MYTPRRIHRHIHTLLYRYRLAHEHDPLPRRNCIDLTFIGSTGIVDLHASLVIPLAFVDSVSFLVACLFGSFFTPDYGYLPTSKHLDDIDNIFIHAD